MRRRGRPSKGLNHVDSLPGVEEDRRRLKVVLSTLTGDRTVKEAAAELGVTEVRLAEIRRAALAGALEGVSPGLPGRPRKLTAPEPGRLEALESRNRWLEEELQCAYARTEIAIALPHLLNHWKAPRAEKKGSSPKVQTSSQPAVSPGTSPRSRGPFAPGPDREGGGVGG